MPKGNIYNEIKRLLENGGSCKVVAKEYAEDFEKSLSINSVPHVAMVCAGGMNVMFVAPAEHEMDFLECCKIGLGTPVRLRESEIVRSSKAMGYKTLPFVDFAGESDGVPFGEAVCDIASGILYRQKILFGRYHNEIIIHPECIFSTSGNDVVSFLLALGLELSTPVYSNAIGRISYDEEVVTEFLAKYVDISSNNAVNSTVLGGFSSKNGKLVPSKAYVEATRKGIYLVEDGKRRVIFKTGDEIPTSDVYSKLRAIMEDKIKTEDKLYMDGQVWDAFVNGEKDLSAYAIRPKFDKKSALLYIEMMMLTQGIDAAATKMVSDDMGYVRITDPDAMTRAFSKKIACVRKIIEDKNLPEITEFLANDEVLTHEERAKVLEEIARFLPEGVNKPLDIRCGHYSAYVQLNLPMDKALIDKIAERDGSRNLDQEYEEE